MTLDVMEQKEVLVDADSSCTPRSGRCGLFGGRERSACERRVTDG
jgi:hypothetical protein